MNKKILFIEDDAIVRENTSEILSLANYTVFTAQDGKEGIEIALKQPIDLIICDIMMPKLDGFGVLQLAMKNDKLKSIPFIFLSAKTNHSDLRKGMELGADDFITKPFDESELLKAIEIRLRKKESVQIDNSTKISEKKISTKNISAKYISNIKDLIDDLCERDSHFYPKGENLFCEGNRSNIVYLLKSGNIKTFKTSEEGKEFITGLYGNKQFIGNSPNIFDVTLNENAQTLSDSKVIKIEKSEIKKILEENPHLTFDFINMLVTNISEDKEKMLQMAYSSVRGRVAKTILNLTENKANKTVEFSRSDLANLTGIAKETLIRTLSDFKDEGYIDIDKNNITIIELKKIQKIT
jgi:CheY-like chemotaxis protein/CRP-like cAMP-binding protein